MKNWLIIMFFCFIIMVLTACGNGEHENKAGENTSEREKQVLNLTIGDALPTMDPAMASEQYSFHIIANGMEGLYRLGENAIPVEGIAMNHSVSKDGLTWTFHLRQDAQWENGDPVTAHDFVYAWRRAIDPKTGSVYGPYMMNDVIKNATAISQGELPPEELGVKAADDYTLIVELENPTPYFMGLTTFGTFLPLNQKFVEQQGERFGTSSETTLSNGPFKIEEWNSTATSWKLVKNNTYWDADTVQLEEITFEVIKDPNTAVQLYEQGTVDLVDIASDLVDKYSSREDFQVNPQYSITFLRMNQNHEALANKNIRLAISQAFNKEALVNEILNNGSIVANGFVPEKFVTMPDTGEDYRDVSGDIMTYDLNNAQSNWQKGLTELGKKEVELELLLGDNEVTTVMGEYLKNQLETNLTGLSITLKPVPAKQKNELERSMNYDISISSWIPDYRDPYTFLNMWITDGPNNNTGYTNEKYDRLLEETATTLANNPNERFENFLEAERILLEDGVIAPIYQYGVAQLLSPKVKDVFANATTYEYKWGYIE